MHNLIADALAHSSAHGIGRIVTSKSVPLRVMWIILFLTFLSLFCTSAWTLVGRIINMKAVKTVESDIVKFEFPDLYFCPSQIYSGSIPFNLDREEAELVNSEVTRLANLYDKAFKNTSDYGDTFTRVQRIQQSMNISLMNRFLLQRPEVVFMWWPQLYALNSAGYFDSPNVSVFAQPSGHVCFKATFSDEQRKLLGNKRAVLFGWLFTDQFLSDFKYSGYPINPIVNPVTNESVPFDEWQSINGIQGVTSAGFTLLLVPKNTYPSLLTETKMKLAPGHSYQISVSMDEVAYSHELHYTHCLPNHAPVAFKDHLTDERVEYEYSGSVCFYNEMNNLILQKYNCVYSFYPQPWHLRNYPRMKNLTEMMAAGVDENTMGDHEDYISNGMAVVHEKCRSQRPCTFKEYRTEVTFDKWPTISKAFAKYLAKRLEEYVSTDPLSRQLVKLANEISAGNHSASTEAQFQHYVGDTMMEIEISVKNHKSPQVLVHNSYSWTAFMADAGGLLGLYIGCSLLTVCEVLDLLYNLLCRAVRRLVRTGDGKGDNANDGGGSEGAAAAAAAADVADKLMAETADRPVVV